MLEQINVNKCSKYSGKNVTLNVFSREILQWWKMHFEYKDNDVFYAIVNM